MIQYINNGTVIINKDIILTYDALKKNIITPNYNWESWMTDINNETFSYRLVLKFSKSQSGDVFLVVDFTTPINSDSLVCSWSLTSEKLGDGGNEKSKKVMHNLKQWFKKETGVSLPIANSRMRIDTAYDPWNCIGRIVCNYR